MKTETITINYKYESPFLAQCFREMTDFIFEIFGKEISGTILQIRADAKTSYEEYKDYSYCNGNVVLTIESELYQEDNGAGGLPRDCGSFSIKISQDEKLIFKTESQTLAFKFLPISFDENYANEAERIVQQLQEKLKKKSGIEVSV